MTPKSDIKTTELASIKKQQGFPATELIARFGLYGILAKEVFKEAIDFGFMEARDGVWKEKLLLKHAEKYGYNDFVITEKGVKLKFRKMAYFYEEHFLEFLEKIGIKIPAKLDLVGGFANTSKDGTSEQNKTKGGSFQKNEKPNIEHRPNLQMNLF